MHEITCIVAIILAQIVVTAPLITLFYKIDKEKLQKQKAFTEDYEKWAKMEIDRIMNS